jgi:regulator of replication initiation timing
MTLAHAPEGSRSNDEPSPDSGNLRVSLNTAYESGIPPARERLARRTDSDAALEQLELVLVESTRAEANLGLLLRGLKHLTTGAAAAQESNAILAQELEALRQRMGKVYESESLLQKRVQTLENALDGAARERESWLVQEDAFLAGLLDEHEQKLFEVERQHERKLAELDLSFDELRRQHDNVRTEVMRLTYERDAAVALLNEPVAITERTPATNPPSSPSSSGSRLGSVRLPPILKPKPDVSTRPLVGYSMVSDEAGDDLVDQSKITQRPPRP